MRITQTKGGVHLHVRTCKPLFRTSGTVESIALQYGMWIKRDTGYVSYISHGCVPISERSHVRSSFPYFGNGWTLCN